MRRLTWGLIGGGEGSQIGPVHRMAAGLNASFALAAAAPDVDPARGREFAIRLGVDPSRAYGNWQEMLAGERGRADRLDLVTVATPNNTHHEIAGAFLDAGFHVLVEKPMTVTVAEAEDLVALAAARGVVCAVNYGYSGYPMVRQMRAMAAGGEIGRVRLIKAEFAHGYHADAADADNPRALWRYDPAQAGISAVFADCGIHALHMAAYVSGQQPESLSADFAACVPGRLLEDDAMVNVRMDGGARLRLWASAVAVGRWHGLNLQVFGETGGLRWVQEWPNQLHHTPVGGCTRVLERGATVLSPEALRAGRTAMGHTEGIIEGFANLYLDLAEVIAARKAGRAPDPLALHYPTAEDGLRSVAAIAASVQSAANGGAWTGARPAGLR